MPIRSPARNSEEYTCEIDNPDQAHELVLRTLRDLSWTLDEVSPDRITASVGMNLFSAGEKIEIEFLPTKTLRITSRCAMRTQCFDWGKNRRNVANFIGSFQNNVTVAVAAGASAGDSDSWAPGRSAAEAFPDEAPQTASVVSGQCRFEVVVKDGSGMFFVEPIAASAAARRARRPSRHRSFRLTSGSRASQHHFSPQRDSAPLKNVSEILIEAGREGSAGFGLAIVCLLLSCTVVGFSVAVYLWQQSSRAVTPAVTPAVTFFYDAATGDAEIDEYGMKTIDLEDASAADAVHRLLKRNTSIRTQYQ